MAELVRADGRKGNDAASWTHAACPVVRITTPGMKLSGHHGFAEVNQEARGTAVRIMKNVLGALLDGIHSNGMTARIHEHRWRKRLQWLIRRGQRLVAAGTEQCRGGAATTDKTATPRHRQGGFVSRISLFHGRIGWMDSGHVDRTLACYYGAMIDPSVDPAAQGHSRAEAGGWHGQIRPRDIQVSAVRSQGAGGQNVNKVASAAHLRFDIRSSDLPADVKRRLLDSGDSRITSDGIIVIKAQRYRTLSQNRADAVARLHQLVQAYATSARRRVPTRPRKSAVEKRLRNKAHRAAVKQNRRSGSME